LNIGDDTVINLKDNVAGHNTGGERGRRRGGGWEGWKQRGRGSGR